MLAAASCCVCSAPAGPHNYYGARVSRVWSIPHLHLHHALTHQACIPCRAFFRRSVEEDLKSSYFCYKSKVSKH